MIDLASFRFASSRSRRNARRIGTACAAFALSATSVASAQDSREGSWHRHERPPESPQRFAVELRFGPYHPHVDDAFANSTIKPYADTFGADKKPFYFGLEFDWQFLRLSKLGTLGAGFGWGFTNSSTNAVIRRTGEPSASETSLTIMPMYAVGVLRVDFFARETVIPIVPYGKAGLGYGLWWSKTEPSATLKGSTWGTQFALGGMLLLDTFDEHASVELDNEWGVNSSYFFMEWMISNLSGFGDSNDRSVLNIGANTWVLGLALEM